MLMIMIEDAFFLVSSSSFSNRVKPEALILSSGPYSGRNSNLVGFTAGVVTNPNCEYDANYVAIHTLGSWKKSYKGVKDTKIIEDVFPTKKPLDEQVCVCDPFSKKYISIRLLRI